MKKIIAFLIVILILFCGLFMSSCNGMQNAETPLPDDNYEENDSIDIAYMLPENAVLNALFGTGIANPGDDDWYNLQVTGDNGLNMNILIDVITYSGSKILWFDLTDDDGNCLTWTGVETTGSDTIIYTLPAAGTYFIHVYDCDAAAAYNLSWYCTLPSPDDKYEENDTLETAYTLPEDMALNGISGNGIAYRGDADWYKLTVSGTDGLQIHILGEITYYSGTKLLYFNLIDETGYFHAGAGSYIVGTFSITYILPDAGTYYIRVYNNDINAVAGYNISWYCTPALADDNYEENDTQETAYVLPENTALSAISGTGITNGGDPDYYKLLVSGTNGLQIHIPVEVITFSGTNFFTILLSDGVNTLSALHFYIPGMDTITCEVPVAGTYFLYIYGSGDISAAYDLSWYCTP